VPEPESGVRTVLSGLKIAVLVKQVPETSDVKIDEQTYTLVREGVPSIINPFDTYAIEESLRIKERHGATVFAISMGPPQAEQALKDCIALGVDEALLLSDRAFAGADTLATAYTLSCAVKRIGADVILCGKQAIDGDTAQVGPGVAEELDIPHATYVRKIDINSDHAIVERLVEGGYEKVRVELPALFTVVKEINEPRLPSLRGKLRAKNAKVDVLTASDLEVEPGRIGLEGSPTQVIKTFSPEFRTGGEMLCGQPDEVAKQLIERLEAVLR